MDALYPDGPELVDDAFAAPNGHYRRSAALAVTCLGLFVGLYLLLTALFAWIAIRALQSATSGASEHVFWLLLLAATSAFITIFLLKALFFVRKGTGAGGLEITPDDQPQLFAFLHRLADDTGAPRPHRVFLTSRVNAAVFYDLTLLNLLMPSKKNLEIGLGLVNVLDLGELKAVLAHEFGHFRQGSMAIGRWVTVAQQVAAHVVQKRDALDRLLTGLAGMDFRIAWVGWVLQVLVWALRALVDSVFLLVVVAQRSLSREMEFQADLVAVSVSGSDALIHALHKLQSADGAWDRALSVALLEAEDGRRVPDLFELQTWINGRVGEILDDQYHASPPPIPELNPESHRLFDSAEAHPPLMWSTHPPNDARENNAKRRYLQVDPDPRSAWMLFGGVEALRQDVTRRLLDSVVPDSQQRLEFDSTTGDVARALRQEYGRSMFDRQYQGLYLGRAVTRSVRTSNALFIDCEPSEGLSPADYLRSAYPPDVSERLSQSRKLEAERATLVAIRDGRLRPCDGVVRYRGEIIRRREISSVLEGLDEEIRVARDRVTACDRQVRSVYREAAGWLGRGWRRYHSSLVSMLHYAEHTEADLLDAQGQLGNAWSVAIADGTVSESEAEQLLSIATDLYEVMRNIDRQRDQVGLSDRLAQRLRTRTWREVFGDEEFRLPPPDRSNLGDWLDSVDGWVHFFSVPLGDLRTQTMEELLALEAALQRSIMDYDLLGDAPVPATVPSHYSTLLPGEERSRQTKLSAWDRFQTADGIVPGFARFAVASVIVGGVLGYGVTVL